MSDNKVIFGLENLHFGTFDQDIDGRTTMGDPYHLAGAVRMSQEPNTEEVEFHADNKLYYKSTDDNGSTGEFEVAQFPDEFKVRFLNWVNMPGGGIAQKKDKRNATVYTAFEFKGDAQKRRGILWNVELGQITREYSTTEKTKEPVTATLPYTAIGDDFTGLTKLVLKPGDEGYDTIFTDPPAPVEPIQYKKTTDTTVSSGKTYYTVEAAAVINPISFELDTYYEKTGTTYALTEDSIVNDSKTYYRLSGTVVASPSGNPSTSGYYEEA